MKHTIKRLTLMALGLTLIISLAGCDLLGMGGVTAKDAQVYIQGRLDALYHGEYNKDYLDLMDDFTEADAKEMYDSNVQMEAEYFMNWLWMEEMTDEQITKAEELVRAIYAKSTYEVGKAETRSGGNYAIPVKIDPIDIMVNFPDEVLQELWDGVTEAVDADEVSNMSDAEYDELMLRLNLEYNDIVLAEVEGLISSIGYGKQQSLLLQLDLGEDDYYSINESDWKNLDYMIIDYYGEYQ